MKDAASTLLQTLMKSGLKHCVLFSKDAGQQSLPESIALQYSKGIKTPLVQKRHLVYAAVAQPAERHLAMVEVTGSGPVCCSIRKDTTSNADDSISSTVAVKGTPGTDT